MNIESSLERIADALDAIVGKMYAKDTPVQAPEPKKAKPVAPKVEDAIPGMDAPVAEAPTGMTSKDLRDMAQKYIQAAGDKTGAIVKYIQGVAKKFNPAEPKLIKIPDAKAAEAAKLIEDECKKQGIAITIEV